MSVALKDRFANNYLARLDRALQLARYEQRRPSEAIVVLTVDDVAGILAAVPVRFDDDAIAQTLDARQRFRITQAIQVARERVGAREDAPDFIRDLAALLDAHDHLERALAARSTLSSRGHHGKDSHSKDSHSKDSTLVERTDDTASGLDAARDTPQR